MMGWRREWVAQKYQLFQWRSAHPLRLSSQKWRRVSLIAHARAILRPVSLREAKRPRRRLGRFSREYSHRYFEPARDLSPSAVSTRFSYLRTVSTALPR